MVRLILGVLLLVLSLLSLIAPHLRGPSSAENGMRLEFPTDRLAICAPFLIGGLLLIRSGGLALRRAKVLSRAKGLIPRGTSIKADKELMRFGPWRIKCPRCGLDFEQNMARSPLGFPTFTCHKCRARFSLPLTRGYRAIYFFSVVGYASLLVLLLLAIKRLEPMHSPLVEIYLGLRIGGLAACLGIDALVVDYFTPGSPVRSRLLGQRQEALGAIIEVLVFLVSAGIIFVVLVLALLSWLSQ